MPTVECARPIDSVWNGRDAMSPWTISRCLAAFRHGAAGGLILTIVSPVNSSAQSREPSPGNVTLEDADFRQPCGSSVFQYARDVPGHPGIERTRQGRLWACYFSGSTGEGGPNNYAMLKTSTNKMGGLGPS